MDILKEHRIVSTLRDQIFNALKEAILTNQFQPGEELKVEELAVGFGVSGTPVREALVRLADMGLVDLAPNRGVKVSLIRAEDVKAVWEVRRVLEPYAARLAVSNCPAEEITALEKQLSAVLKDPSNFSAYIESDFAVHAALYKYLENRLLRTILDQVNSQYMRIRYFAESGSAVLQREVVRQVTLEHFAIVKAMHKREPDEVAREVENHLRNGENRTLATLAGRASSTVKN